MFVLTDMDTNVNKDVEQLFIKRGVNYWVSQLIDLVR
jgi:hypothetical protein